MNMMTTNSASVHSAARELTPEEINEVNGGIPRGWAIAGGIAVGVGEAGHAAGAIRAGLFGARIGAFGGPIGLGIGVVAGVGTYYILRSL